MEIKNRLPLDCLGFNATSGEGYASASTTRSGSLSLVGWDTNTVL
jgi:hypothetical protein